MNKLYHGENLQILRELPDASVDLIATDPPFNTGKDWGAFSDKWDGGLEGYLKFMEQRCVEMHRVLKDTGSFYLHCDPSFSHYLKVMLDKIFGMKQFRNEIVWDKRYGHPNDVKRKYPMLHDILLFYTKTDAYTFTPLYRALSEDYVKTTYRYVDDDGRRYRLGPTKDKMRRKTIENRSRIYLDESKGTSIGSLWIGSDTKLSSFSKERRGYPTQKPVSLYERIIKVSSDQGDVVLDPFVGSGTTLDAAELLGRQWIGIDEGRESIEIIQERLRERYGLEHGRDYDLVKV